ncbi:hypothetical protein MBLNU230_g3311t1 [Neophaeotheca triangularis]
MAVKMAPGSGLTRRITLFPGRHRAHQQRSPLLAGASPRAVSISASQTRHPIHDELPDPRGKPRPQCRGNKILDLDDNNGTWHSVSGRWLRDHCYCAECRNPQTGQRQINVLSDARLGAIKECSRDEHSNYNVIFGDGHRSTFSASAIANRNRRLDRWSRTGTVSPVTWTSRIADDPPAVHYDTLEGNTRLGDLLSKIRTHGFCFVHGSPPTPEATQTLLEAIGPIRNTHYGGFYDFTSDLSSKDTAYTSEALEPHTDNTYFTEPAGLQALHMLSHTEGSGGESSLVDGFQAAKQLYETDEEAYRTLLTTGVYAHASGNEDVKIQPTAPVPVISFDKELQQVVQVRWNTADRSELTNDWTKIDQWYDAAAKFNAIVNDLKNQYWFSLQPGKILIFDNWRVLHGRSAFTGKRRMCGGYINRDDYISRYRVTNMTPEQLDLYT